jgi:transposase
MSKDSKRSRRQFSTEQKAAMLRRHLVDKVPISDLCDEYKLQPGLFYQWQRQLFDNLVGALEKTPESGPSQREKKLGERIEFLEARIVRKDSVIAEISAEYVQLKKELGEP